MTRLDVIVKHPGLDLSRSLPFLEKWERKKERHLRYKYEK